MKQACCKKAAPSIYDHVKCKEMASYVLKMNVNKWMSNIVITGNVMKAPHIYKVQWRCIG